MSEVALSTDQLPSNLVSIATKIKSHKNNIGYSFIEIGKELIRAKKEDVAHGEWQLFLDEINMSKSQADRHIKIAEEYELGKLPNVGNIGFNALYQIATIPEEHRSEAFNEDGTVKTVRELQEVKRKLKQTEQENLRLSELLTEERTKQPEVIEKEIEVVPDRVKHELDSTKRQLSYVSRQLEELERYKQNYELRKDNFDEEEVERQRKKLIWEAEKNVLTLKIKVDKFLEEVAITAFMEGAIASSGKSTKEKLKESVDMLKSFTNKMDTALKGRIEV